jgi:Tat protein secretion system quality control protein TatD with DNase activity
MSSVPNIKNKMRTSALAIMATRSQDQQLVADVAADLGLKSRAQLRERQTEEHRGGAVVVPAFGWHPWFSHQIQDDISNSAAQDSTQTQTAAEAKAVHYTSVLTPTPDEPFLASLPNPTLLSQLLDQIRTHLSVHPLALVGEIGLDKAFRLPSAPEPASSPQSSDLTPGGREGRRLSPYRVKPEHQRAILEAQLKLAGEMSRGVSVHGVQAHGLLLETVSKGWKGHEKEVISRRKRRLVAEGAESSDSDSEDDSKSSLAKRSLPYPPRICLHSFSASPEVLRQWLNPTIPSDIYFSFSIAVNAGSAGARDKLRAVIQLVPNGKILVESDLHIAGEEMDAALEDMYRFVCEVKGWELEEGVKRIAKNYEAFIFG